jgi:hypothetical protein
MTPRTNDTGPCSIGRSNVLAREPPRERRDEKLEKLSFTRQQAHDFVVPKIGAPPLSHPAGPLRPRYFDSSRHCKRARGRKAL